MKNIIKERLVSVLHNRDWSVSDLADKCDIPLDTLKNVYYGRSDNPKLETLIAIADALDVSIDFLVGRTNYAKDEMEILKNYRKSSSHGKQFILSMSKFESKYTEFENTQKNIKEIDCYCPQVSEENIGDNKIKYYIPCLEPTGLFKDGVLYDTSIKTRISTHLNNVFMAVKIPNDSLADTYYKGDIVLLEQRRPNVGEIAIYHKDNYIYIRQYGRDENRHILHSLNINNKDIILTNAEMQQYKVVGTCIYIHRKN